MVTFTFRVGLEYVSTARCTLIWSTISLVVRVLLRVLVLVPLRLMVDVLPCPSFFSPTAVRWNASSLLPHACRRHALLHPGVVPRTGIPHAVGMNACPANRIAIVVQAELELSDPKGGGL